MELCVALDNEEKKDNLALVKELKGLDVWLKVGLRSFIRDGKEIIDEIKQLDSNFKIFLDLKIYDIPNTMADAAEEMAHLSVDMFNLHASAGKKAMKEVMKRVQKFESPPLVLAVTALTSFDEKSFKKIYNTSIEKKASSFAHNAYKSGVNGVVCSVYESSTIKALTCKDFITLTPGIRPFGESIDDQSRVANILKAKLERSDFIVVGRPIYRAKNPRSVVERILEEIGSSGKRDFGLLA